MYDDEVDAVKLESRSLFTTGSNWICLKTRNLNWLFFKGLLVEIAVPWNEKANQIVYFLFMFNVLL